PVPLIEEDALVVMLSETERRLEPNALLTYLFTQLEAVLRVPRRVSQVVDRLETGTLKVGVVPTDLADVEHVLRSMSNRVGVALIVVGLLARRALSYGNTSNPKVTEKGAWPRTVSPSR